MFEDIAENFIEGAIDHLRLIESDHMVTILLETKSDIDNLSALDMAFEYRLQTFVANNRIERISTSLMNVWEFLRPKNRSDAFEIDPFSVELVWKKMEAKEFYFTPLGIYVTTVFLYSLYLILFSAVSVRQFQVYHSPMEAIEYVFWICNIAYVVNEVQMARCDGMHQYFSQVSNYFDVIISAVFISCFILRIYGLEVGPTCEDGVDEDETHCWTHSKLNTVFVILWGVACVVLWLRVIVFCVLSHNLGPLVQMIYRMMGDIITFFEIMLIVFAGFGFALLFVLENMHRDFDDPIEAGVTLLRAVLGDFEFDTFKENSTHNQGLIYVKFIFQFVYGKKNR